MDYWEGWQPNGSGQQRNKNAQFHCFVGGFHFFNKTVEFQGFFMRRNPWAGGVVGHEACWVYRDGPLLVETSGFPPKSIPNLMIGLDSESFWMGKVFCCFFVSRTSFFLRQNQRKKRHETTQQHFKGFPPHHGNLPKEPRHGKQRCGAGGGCEWRGELGRPGGDEKP